MHIPYKATHRSEVSRQTSLRSANGFRSRVTLLDLSLSHWLRKGCIVRQSAAATATENSILCCHPNSKASCGAKIPASTPPMGTPVNRIEKIRFLFFCVTTFDNKCEAGGVIMP